MQDKFKSKIYECDTKVIHNHIINNDYRHLILSAPRKALDIIPGQFFHLQCPPSESSWPLSNGSVTALQRLSAGVHQGVHGLLGQAPRGATAQGRDGRVQGPRLRGLRGLPPRGGVRALPRPRAHGGLARAGRESR